MNGCKPIALLLAGGLLAGPAIAAEDHEPAPLLAPANAPMTEEAFAEGNQPQGRQESPEVILERFRDRFATTAGTPRLAVFWSRSFPDRVSDWRSNSRVALGISGEASGIDKGLTTDMRGQGAITAQAEYRGNSSARGQDTAFALQSGLIDTFRESDTTVVDQAMAQRITDNALEDGTFSRLSPDQARLEMRALSQHADYVLELTTSPDFAEDGQYRVRVLSVQDASVLTAFTTTGKPPEDERESKWVATDKGYEKRERPLSMAEVGRELALQTMARMSR